jgi:hypothetical protein
LVFTPPFGLFSSYEAGFFPNHLINHQSAITMLLLLKKKVFHIETPLFLAYRWIIKGLGNGDKVGGFGYGMKDLNKVSLP